MFLRKEFTTAMALAIAVNLPLALPASSARAVSNLPTTNQIDLQLRQGDLVRLRSGGPFMMTIGTIEGDQVVCVWNENGQTDDATFPAEVLQKLF
jgi:uncharacterized protein YodC (DUF2158 family)